MRNAISTVYDTEIGPPYYNKFVCKQKRYNFQLLYQLLIQILKFLKYKNVKKSTLFSRKSKITFEILINDGGKEIEDEIVKVVENSRVLI